MFGCDSQNKGVKDDLEVVFSEMRMEPLDKIINKLEEVNHLDVCDVLRKPL